MQRRWLCCWARHGKQRLMRDAAAYLIRPMLVCVTCRQDNRQTACKEAKNAAGQALEAKAADAAACVVELDQCVCDMQARQQADSFEAEVSAAAGQAADAWALVEAMEAKGDAAAAADKAAQAVALQQQYQERQAAADTAASQAQQQVHNSGLGACYSTPCMASLTHAWHL